MMKPMTEIDVIALALCVWRECRGGGHPGMQAVANVVLNRAAKNGSSVYAEVYRPLQFSSMSYQHDPQLFLQPEVGDFAWSVAKSIAVSATTGCLEDATNGADHYYAESLKPAPQWAAKMKQTAVIGGQIFLKE